MTTIDDWIEKANSNLSAAREAAKWDYSTAVQRSQECIELSVKAILDVLGIQYRKVHEWTDKEVQNILEDARNKNADTKLESKGCSHIRLARLIVLSNLWGRFYLPAKYGMEGGFAAAQDLFTLKEANLAVEHADECLMAAVCVRSAFSTSGADAAFA